MHAFYCTVAGQVLLLAMGQTAFFGPAIESLEHFSSLGYLYKPYSSVNPADHLLEVRLTEPRRCPKKTSWLQQLGPAGGAI